jgi:hypothetical protein
MPLIPHHSAVDQQEEGRCETDEGATDSSRNRPEFAICASVTS